MMELAYLGVICLTLIILVTNVAGHVSTAKKKAAELKAEIDKRQIESAFPPEKPEKPSLEQQAFDVKRLREQQAIDAQLQATQQIFEAKKKALDHVLARRETLEAKIDETRTRVTGYSDKQYAQYRTDALEALSDMRKEQAELVVQQAELLTLVQGDEDESQVDAPKKPVRVDPGGPVAGRVDDPDQLHDVEPDEPEASRAGVA